MPIDSLGADTDGPLTADQSVQTAAGHTSGDSAKGFAKGSNLLGNKRHQVTQDNRGPAVKWHRGLDIRHQDQWQDRIAGSLVSDGSGGLAVILIKGPEDETVGHMLQRSSHNFRHQMLHRTTLTMTTGRRTTCTKKMLQLKTPRLTDALDRAEGRKLRAKKSLVITAMR